MIEKFRKTIKDKNCQKIDDFKPNTWIHVLAPNKKEIQELVEKCSLKKDLIKDALDPFEAPRIETEENITYVFTRAPHKENDIISTFPILIAISDNHLITISNKKLDFLENFLNNKEEFTTTQRIKLFIQFFSELTKDYNRSLTEISRGVRAKSVRFEKTTTKDIIQFVDFERIINDFLFALTPTNTMLHNLLSGKHLRLYERDIDLVEDLFLSNKQLIDTCSSTLKNIVNIRDAYSTVVTQDTNRIIKLFTSLTIILTIPTIISSVYGMNVGLPFSSSPLAFWGIIFGIVLIVYILITIFAKKDWL